MAAEIERKFLLAKGAELPASRGTPAFMQQVYLASGAAAVRVRLTDDQAWLTVKSSNAGMTRQEFEYTIPREDAQAMARLPGVRGLTKTRHLVPHGDLNYELDVYHGGLAGLITVEVEIPYEGYPLELPSWIGLEVTDDRRYSNEALANDGLPA